MGYRFIDQYSLLHFAVGIVAYFLGINFKLWLLLNIIYEIIENSQFGIKIINKLSFIWPGGKKIADTPINSVSDIIFAMLGWFIAQQIDIIGQRKGWYVKHIK
jgi:hypothetical protein